jgi:signal transduction histidine kinase
MRHIMTQRDISGRQRALYKAAEALHRGNDGSEARVHHGTDDALRRLNESLDEQAKRIAQTLHDEAGQLLTCAYVALAEAARDLPPAARERLRKVRTHLDRIEDHLRCLAHEIRPRILDDVGLVAALGFLAESVERRRGISISVEAALQRRLPAMVETTVYRLAQEALTNVSKHAGAVHVTIRLDHQPRTLCCTIADDGVGFDVAAVVARLDEQGLGLIGIRDRLDALGGTLEINSAPGRGTELVMTIPLDTV